MKIVPLATFPNEFEARMLAELLGNEGIPAVVKPLGPGYGMAGAIQFIHHRVYVPEDRLDEAMDIAGLASPEGGEEPGNDA